MEEALDRVCRCCLSSDPALSSLSKVLETKGNTNLLEFFIWFSGSEFCHSDTQICCDCETKMLDAFRFRELVRQSEMQLKNHSLILEVKEEKTEIQNLEVVLLPTNYGKPAKKKQKRKPKVNKPRKSISIKCKSLEVVETTCKICKKQFPTEYQMKRHLDIHKEPTFQCDDCGKRFVDQQRLKTHMVAHSSERNVKCPLCPDDKGFFKDKRYLRQHYILSHNDNKREFTCAECGHATKTLQSLKTHLATHFEQLRNFVCEICNSSYVFPRDLARHIQRLHRKERPYKCQQCPKTYMAPHVLATHVKVVHNNFRFQCKYCDKAYNGTSALLEHLFSQHRKDKPYNCTECPNGYISWTNFKNHLKKCHNIVYDVKVHGFKGSFPDILKAGMKQPEDGMGSDILFQDLLESVN